MFGKSADKHGHINRNIHGDVIMEDRRRAEDKNWEEIKSFISESRIYRSADEMTQKYQVENIEALKNAVKIQNGRIFKLEIWQAFILGGVALLGVLGSIVTMAIMWFKK